MPASCSPYLRSRSPAIRTVTSATVVGSSSLTCFPRVVNANFEWHDSDAYCLTDIKRKRPLLWISRAHTRPVHDSERILSRTRLLFRFFCMDSFSKRFRSCSCHLYCFSARRAPQHQKEVKNSCAPGHSAVLQVNRFV